MTWQPIDTAPRELVQGADDPILIAHIDDRGQIIWACAAMWVSVPYGYIQCAQRAGWHADFFPPMARDWHPPKPTGEWIMPTKGLEPTHWMTLPELTA